MNDEIQEHRITEEREPKVRLPITTKLNGNHSGARSSRVSVVYNPASKTQKVIIMGDTFPAAEKLAMGAVPSKYSIAGMLECTDDETEIRCHNCGRWFRRLGAHIRTHGHNETDYKKSHGLPLSTSLASPASRLLTKLHMDRLVAEGKFTRPIKSQLQEFAANARRAYDGGHQSAAVQNMRMCCMAQYTERIGRIAAALGRCPTLRELNAGDEFGKITSRGIKWAFNMTVAEALKSIGLNRGKNNRPKLPRPLQLKVQQMRSQGYSFSEIGKALKMHGKTAWNIVERHKSINPQQATEASQS